MRGRENTSVRTGSPAVDAPPFADWLPEQHLARFVSDLVDALDLTALAEVQRVLRPGGVLVHTVPLIEAGPMCERARIDKGGVAHLVAPEHHGDRLRGRGGALALPTWGPDILDRLRAAGFKARRERFDGSAHAIADGRVMIGLTPA